MENAIIIKNLTFSYDENLIFDNLNLEIKKGSFVSLIGSNCSGKSTLVKILLGLVETNADITINGLKLNEENLTQIRKDIGVVFDNPNNCFVAETVIDDLAFSLENSNLAKSAIEEKIKKVVTELKIEKLLYSDPANLSGGEKQLVALASAIVAEPSILILDEAFAMLDNEYSDKLLKILKKMNKKNKTTIINITHNMEDVLYSNNIVLLDKKRIVIEGKKEKVLKEEEIFAKAGIEMPFMIELSNKLKFYDLVDKNILDMEKMVNTLWK